MLQVCRLPAYVLAKQLEGQATGGGLVLLPDDPHGDVDDPVQELDGDAEGGAVLVQLQVLDDLSEQLQQ